MLTFVIRLYSAAFIITPRHWPSYNKGDVWEYNLVVFGWLMPEKILAQGIRARDSSKSSFDRK